MNRIDDIFSKKDGLLSIYFTAGYPNLNDTMAVLTGLQKAGVDFVEIGMPFSDPLADGPVIQRASLDALNNGMTLHVLMTQLKDMRKSITIPVTLMGYINPIMHYGVENFLRDAANCGVDALIVPDLPWQEYLDNYKTLFDKYGLRNIPLIAPQTPDERMKFLDANADGFIYMVASAGITGNIKTSEDYRSRYFDHVSSLGLKNKRMIGFGVKDNEGFRHACAHASGAIIGTAFVNHIKTNGVSEASIKAFVDSIKKN
ncbi:MAG: tryptophan synthase subunit alpha [Bacteroidales bacterium]|nr:tryptophan synthase subunit alpha [Bacteroidales bacterium]